MIIQNLKMSMFHDVMFQKLFFMPRQQERKKQTQTWQYGRTRSLLG